MCATTKKFSTKAAEPGPGAKSATLSKLHHHHPPWIDMITTMNVHFSELCENDPCPQECITTTPDGNRHGVSRPVIKKFVDSKYHLEMNPLVSSQLNRAIHHGADKGKFVLPKGEPPFIAESFIVFFTRFHIGPSGKVKLAPQRHTEAAKENAKPASKRSTVVKESHVTPIKVATKTAAKKTSRAVKPAATAASPKSRPAEKKYHFTAKKARTTGSSTRRTVGRKAATAQGTAKKTATGKSTKSKTRRGAISAKRTTRAAGSKLRAKKISRK
ncbi:hypothetical protein EDD22DRAFT_958724 [Suillus occidentalis]|nr:hypothetical protein EDD22DRAFT_958724 [Suillus occidentalis]